VTDTSVPEGAGLAARTAALDLFATALTRRAALEDGLAAPALASLEPRDRAFARALAMATLRHLGPIDIALQSRLQKPPPERVVNILRLGLAQAFVLMTPPHAAVATSVDLAHSAKATMPFKGLINAVLRALLREPPDLADPERLAPAWLFARWTSAYGAETARAIAATIAEEPPTDLSLKDPAEADRLAAELEAQVLPGGSLRTERRGDVAGWPDFDKGLWWVQDAAAAIPGRLLAAQPGETALDLCAAPGGKTMQLAAAGAQVAALDRSAARLERLKANLARVGLSAEATAADATIWDDRRTFDAVLLDAPCSATGTFRRHPDVLWVGKPSDLAGLASAQSRLLDAAAARTKPGGRLVYCVCSLEPEEGEAQVAAFLTRHKDFRLDPLSPGEGGAPEASLRDDGALRILPCHLAGGLDGFYAARLVRRPPSGRGAEG
jgi:16S rRNA (cytosine967-C5)-methyltransferase